MLVESSVSIGRLASACPEGCWQPQSRDPNFPTSHEQLPFCWLGLGRSSFQHIVFELVDRGSRAGAGISAVRVRCPGTISGTGPGLRVAASWHTCEGSSLSAEQVFARRLCWDFLRAQAMHAWSEIHWDCCLGLQKGSCFHFLTLSLLWRSCKICSQILPHPWTIRPGVRD